MTHSGSSKGFIVAAPRSVSGKTLITLGLLRAFRNRGLSVGSFKVGPDYIDPGFHEAATGLPCRNIDIWAMRPGTIANILSKTANDTDLIIGEGVMGLFDGAAGGGGSTADVATELGLPTILVVDASGQSMSAAAVIHGFNTFRDDLKIGGVIFNRVGSSRHQDMLRSAMRDLEIPVFGYLPRDDRLALPERHLGLVPAAENTALDRFLEECAETMAAHLDLDGITDLRCRKSFPVTSQSGSAILPLAQRVSVARDVAFPFTYPHIIDNWHDAGAEVSFFSPLSNERPRRGAAVFLPGGYPELHAGQLAANTRFMDGMREAANDGHPIYGECGGYMALGAGLIDAYGERHSMCGLLPLVTSFAEPRLHLGYQDAELLVDTALGKLGTRFRGHEFHYATVVEEGEEDPLFQCCDSTGEVTSLIGRRVANVSGSFLHLIDRYS